MEELHTKGEKVHVPTLQGYGDYMYILTSTLVSIKLMRNIF